MSIAADIESARKLLDVASASVETCFGINGVSDVALEDVRNAAFFAKEALDHQEREIRRLRAIITKSHKYQGVSRSGSREEPGCTCGWESVSGERLLPEEGRRVHDRHIAHVLDAP